MLDFLMPLVVPIGVIAVVIGGPIYLACASADEDALYFLRKKQFKEKVLKSGHKNTWDLLITLLDTTEKDWKTTGSYMFYEPYPNTKIFFSNMMWLELEIIEGSGKREVFDMCYFDDSKQIGYGCDFITKQSLKEEDTFRMKQVMFHLNELFKNLINNKNRVENERLKMEEERRLKKKKIKKEQLLSMIEKQPHIVEDYGEEGFIFRLKKEESYQSFTISFEDTIYFQALHLEKTGKLETTIHNQENENSKIFAELKSELDQYAKNILGEESYQTSSTCMNEKTFEENYQDRINPINQLINDLEKEEEWLSVESFHQVKETFPNDMKALSEVYRVVNDKEKVREDIEHSLQTIYKKLLIFKEESERNKHKEIRKRKMVIENR